MGTDYLYHIIYDMYLLLVCYLYNLLNLKVSCQNNCLLKIYLYICSNNVLRDKDGDKKETVQVRE